jgi:hypothetical protein
MGLLFMYSEHAEIVDRRLRVSVQENKPLRSTTRRAGSSA